MCIPYPHNFFPRGLLLSLPLSLTVRKSAVRRANARSSDDYAEDGSQPPPPGLYSDPDLAPNRGVADSIGRATAAIDEGISGGASQALLTRQ